MLHDLMRVFESYRMTPTSIDQYEQIGRIKLVERIKSFVDRDMPLQFSLLGFPMKSPNNRDKVLGSLPDLGEELAIQNFGQFNKDIKQYYEHGIVLNVISDGYVFNDIMEVKDNIVHEYEEINIDTVHRNNVPIAWYDLKDFYMGSDINNMRNKVISQFGISPEELEKRILLDPNVNAIYRGMIKFLSLDIAIKDFDSNNKLQKEAKRLAREMMFRNEAYSALIASEFKEAIRLSMHPSTNNGTKYSFQLIKSDKIWTSPWHSAILIDENGIYNSIHKKDAVTHGLQLVHKNGQPYYYEVAA